MHFSGNMHGGLGGFSGRYPSWDAAGGGAAGGGAEVLSGGGAGGANGGGTALGTAADNPVCQKLINRSPPENGQLNCQEIVRSPFRTNCPSLHHRYHVKIHEIFDHVMQYNVI